MFPDLKFHFENEYDEHDVKTSSAMKISACRGYRNKLALNN